MTSALSDEGGFELRVVVKPLVFVCRHLALLALRHLFRRQATRNTSEDCIALGRRDPKPNDSQTGSHLALTW
jgi:hypothetical protein